MDIVKHRDSVDDVVVVAASNRAIGATENLQSQLTKLLRRPDLEDVHFASSSFFHRNPRIAGEIGAELDPSGLTK